jgi:DNA-binding XRE family transcriptional regulator
MSVLTALWTVVLTGVANVTSLAEMVTQAKPPVDDPADTQSDRDRRAIGARWREARISLDLSQQAVADAVGKSKQLVSAIEAGRVDTLGTITAVFCRTFHIDPTWLVLGKVAASPGPPEPRSLDMGTSVPHIDAHDIVRLRSADGNIALKSASRRRVIAAASDRAFSTTVVDAGMAPELLPGDHVVVDPARPATIGSVVCLLQPGRGVTFARMTRTGKPEADNPGVDVSQNTIGLGVVIEATRAG